MHSLSIVIPAYNEERRLPQSLESILAYIATLPLTFSEVIVVNDGSSDGTAGVALEYGRRDARVRLLENPGNRGKGYSVRHGMLEARGEWTLFTDADLSAPMEELAKLLDAVKRAGAQVAIGSRALDRSMIGTHQSAAREYAGRIFNIIMRAITGLPFEDTQCGFKLYHSESVKQIFPLQQLEGFGFDVEDLYLAKLHGISVVETPVRWNNVEGTKVSLWNGLDSFLDPVRIRWYHLRGRYSAPKVSS